MAAGFQQFDGVWADALLNADLVRQPLVVHAWGADGGLYVHIVINYIHDHLQGGGDNAGTARAAGNQHVPAVFTHDGGRHGTEHALAGLDLVGFAADQAIGVGGTGPGAEIVHFVVQQKAGTRHGDARAVAEVDGVGVGYRIAPTVHHRKVGRFRAFKHRRLAGLDFQGRAGLVRVNGFAEFCGVVFAGQPGQGHLHKVGVAKVFGPVGVGQFHGLGHVVQGVGRVVPPFANREVLKNIQDLNDVGATRGGRRHRKDIVSPVVALHRLADCGLIVCQIVQGDQAIAALHLFHDQPGGFALVKALDTLVSNTLKGGGQLRLPEDFSGLRCGAIFLIEGIAGGGPALQAIPCLFQPLGKPVWNHKAIPGQANGRRQGLF